MSISLNKLSKLLDRCNFYINHYFSIKTRCIFIEVVSKDTGSTYLMYIPSKYEISTKGESSVFELKEIDGITNSTDVTYEYGYDSNHKDFEEMYSMMNIEDKVNEGVLNNNYNKKIEINDVKSKDNEKVKSIYRQMKRFKYSVENLKYKLAIMYNSYLCCVSRKNEVDFYYIKNFPKNTNQKRLVVCFDLEILYNKHYIIHTELTDVKSNLEKLLNKNYDINIQYTTRLISNQINISNIEGLIMTKKEQLNLKYDEYKILLGTTVQKEKIIRESIGNDGRNNQNMIQLKDILSTKSKVIMDMIDMIEKRDNFILLCDNILFDNIIMFDKISKNLNLLDEI
jgi:hypothetical protein